MTSLDMKIRPATVHDATPLAELINQAGEGLPLHVWQEMAAEGEDAWQIGRDRVASPDAGISYKNAWIGQVHGALAGCLIGYRQPDSADPIPEDVTPLFRPLLELEAEAPDTGYVFVLSTVPAHQGQGVGSRLLEFAEQEFRGPAGMSIIVADANHGARRLYERHGYQPQARRAMVKQNWENPGQDWVLMVKPG